MKKMFLFGILVLFLGGIICVAENGSITTEQQKCENDGGIWKLFNNGCVDDCDYIRNPEDIVCAQAMTYG